MKSAPSILGNKAYVDLPTLNAHKVLAKIDTGADSSTIWASEVVERNGTLTFKLFGKNSVHYTGETVTTKSFSQTSVKNSFGEVQIRYKVALKTLINDRLIKVNYTLSNRENNSTPILIGRKTLSGKFLIDVAKQAEERPQRVLVVSKIRSSEVANFVEDVAQELANTTIDYATYDDIVVSFKDGTMSAFVDTFGADLASYDIVHFKTSTKRDITSSLARYAQSKGATVLDFAAIAGFPTMSKLYEYTLLTLNNIPIPDSVFVTPQKAPAAYKQFASQLGLPFVLKDIHGSKGNYNQVIHNEGEYQAMLQSVQSQDIYLIGQKFTPNDGDYRVLVMGHHIELVIYRSRADNSTHLNNTTQGGRATLLKATDLPPAIRRSSLLAARLMGRDIAGVDMVKDKVDGKWYCFEVNDGPQIVTGAFLEQKRTAFAAYIKRVLEKRI